jgi:sugar O-acyltransferase (sialic acid O-acetyltransferase NeuD family)
MNKKLILVGGGGHCKSVIDVAECAGCTILGILGRPEEVGNKVLGYEVVGTDDDMAKYVDVAEFVVTVGQIKSASLRVKLHEMVEQVGGRLAIVVSPTAHVSKYAQLGVGTVVMHHAVINADAIIGKGCIINTFANIEHDVVVGDYSHVSTGAMVNGGCVLGNGCFVGSQGVLSNGVTIVDGIIISAGAFVSQPLFEKGVYAGNPAILKKTITSDNVFGTH